LKENKLQVRAISNEWYETCPKEAQEIVALELCWDK
jgi:hypothetical protein